MARNVTYSVSPRVNPSEKSASPRYYGRVQARGDTGLREMSDASGRLVWYTNPTCL